MSAFIDLMEPREQGEKDNTDEVQATRTSSRRASILLMIILEYL